MIKTNIEWCDSTVNPTDFQCCGCELWNPKEGITDCYAGKFQERRAGKGSFDKPVQLKPGRMAEAAAWSDLTGKDRKDKPWLNGRPRVIFLGDMADVLQPGVPFEYLKTEIIDVVTSDNGRRHIWMILTKQSARLVQFWKWMIGQKIKWPTNLWPGVSVTAQNKLFRVKDLLRIPCGNRFISYEPAFEYVDFTMLNEGYESTDDSIPPLAKIQLIIMGGQSGSKEKCKPFDLNWARKTNKLCKAFFIDFFLKQVGTNPQIIVGNEDINYLSTVSYRKGQDLRFGKPGTLDLEHKKGGNPDEWPADLRVRQFPTLSVLSETPKC